MKKEIIFGQDAIQRLCRGVRILEETVGSTLGPGGRNVIFNTIVDFPLVTKDGVTVAKEIELADKWENIGVQMVKQVASKTCQEAGDGTTTATVLANEILHRGVKVIQANNNPISVLRGINKAVECVVKFIEDNIKIDISNNPEKVRDVAVLSANWDNELGNIVADAILEVGTQGSIEIEDAAGIETYVEYNNGVKFDRGFVNPVFAKDKAALKTVFNKPLILLVQGEFNFTNQIVPLLNQAMLNDTPLVFVADSFGNDALSMLAINSNNPKLNVTCMKAPHYRDMRINTMEDLAVMFGTQYYNFETGDVSIEDIDLSMLGCCEQFIQNTTTSTFVNGLGEESDIEKRIEELEALAADENASELFRENAKLRLKQIISKSAIIRVGSSTEVENNEKRDRIDDAMHATIAALKEGIVPGGSYAYLKARASKELKSLIKNTKNESERLGMEIVKESLKAPFERLMKNAGLVEIMQATLNKVVSSKKPHYGFNVKTEKMCNLIESGVVDPWTVTKSALRNAASVTGHILSSSAVITRAEEIPYTTTVKQNLPTMTM